MPPRISVAWVISIVTAGILLVLLVALVSKHVSAVRSRLSGTIPQFVLTLASPMSIPSATPEAQIASASGEQIASEQMASESCLVRVDPTLCAVMRSWYEMIRGAKRSVWLTTYSFHFTYKLRNGERVVVPQLWYIGLALKHRQLDRQSTHAQHSNDDEQKLRFSAVLNCATMTLTRNARAQKRYISRAMGLWSHMGVDVGAIDWHWYLWSHKQAGNVHAKLILVDDVIVHLSSPNVDVKARRGRLCWGQHGVTVARNSRIARDSVRYARELESRSTRVEPTQAAATAVDYSHERLNLVVLYDGDTLRKESWHALERALLLENDNKLDWLPVPARNVQFVAQMPQSSIWTTSGAECARELLRRIDAAERSIDVMTPNFNSGAIWARLVAACERGVSVRIICGKRYNCYAPLIVKNLFGFRTNEDMYARCVAPAFAANEHVRANLEFRWYGERATRVYTDENAASGHYKLVVIDRATSIIGSFNCDVFSVLNSGEAFVVVESERVARDCLDRTMNVRWAHGVTATG